MCGSFGDSFEKLVAEAVAADGLKGRGVGAEFCVWEGFWSAEWFSLHLTRTEDLRCVGCVHGFVEVESSAFSLAETERKFVFPIEIFAIC